MSNKNHPDQDAIRAGWRRRQNLCRQRRKAGLTPVTLPVPLDILLRAWRARRQIPPYVEDDFLPLDRVKEDLVDVLIDWGTRQLGKD